MSTYHYHYVAVVWNKEDYSDMHIIKNKRRVGLFESPIFFNDVEEAKKYAISNGFTNCELINIFHTRA